MIILARKDTIIIQEIKEEEGGKKTITEEGMVAEVECEAYSVLACFCKVCYAAFVWLRNIRIFALDKCLNTVLGYGR